MDCVLLSFIFKNEAWKKNSTLLTRRSKNLKLSKLTYTYTPVYYKNILIFFHFELTWTNNSNFLKTTSLLETRGNSSWNWVTLLLITPFLFFFFKWYVQTFLFTTVNGAYFQIQKFGVEVLFNEIMCDLMWTPRLTHSLIDLLF